MTESKCPWPPIGSVGRDFGAPMPSDLWELCREIARDARALLKQTTHTNDYLSALVEEIESLRGLVEASDKRAKAQAEEVAAVKELLEIINHKLTPR